MATWFILSLPDSKVVIYRWNHRHQCNNNLKFTQVLQVYECYSSLTAHFLYFRFELSVSRPEPMQLNMKKFSIHFSKTHSLKSLIYRRVPLFDLHESSIHLDFRSFVHNFLSQDHNFECLRFHSKHSKD